MSVLSIPSISDLPLLSTSSISSGSTDPSPFPSVLCTPCETRVNSLDDLVIGVNSPDADGEFATPRLPSSEFQPKSLARDTIAKLRPLSRIVAMAKKLATKSLRRALRRTRGRSQDPATELLDGSLPSSSTLPDVPGGWREDIFKEVSILVTQDVTIIDTEEEEEVVDESNLSTSLCDERNETALCQDETGMESDDEDLFDVSPDSLLSTLQSLSSDAGSAPIHLPPIRNIAPTMLRIALFVPWCIAVGGTILLSPAHLEFVTFSPGYMTSPQGPQRFAHWADCAVHHAFIFLACLAVFMWWNISTGALVASAMLARSVYVWSNFRLDSSIPLGEDDRQSLYMVVTQAYMDEDHMVISRIEEKPPLIRVYGSDDEIQYIHGEQ